LIVMQLQMAKAGMHMFVEKPISVRPAEEVARLAQQLKEAQDKQKLVIAVGYMFRYVNSVQVSWQAL
jgi:predicted dehydrogenase